MEDHARAAEHLAQQGDYRQAARKMLEAGDPLRAASYLHKAGAYVEAGEIFERLGDHLRAARCYRDGGETQRQMAMVVTQFEQDLKQRDEEGLARSRRLLPDAARFLASVGELRRMVALLQRAGMIEEAATLLEEHQQHRQAAQLLQQAGQTQRAALTLAREAMAAGDAPRAARLLARVGEYERAGRLLLEAGQTREAADMFVRAKRLALAGQLFERLGDLGRAARCMELGEEHGEAARLYAEAGDARGELRALMAQGDLLRAGRLLIRGGRLDEARQLLEKVEARDPRHREAREQLGDLHSHHRDYASARQAYLQACDGQPAQPGTLELHYKLARSEEADGAATQARERYEQIVNIDSGFRDARKRLTRLSSAPGRRATLDRGGTFSAGRGGSAILKRVRRSNPALEAVPSPPSSNEGVRMSSIIRSTGSSDGLVRRPSAASSRESFARSPSLMPDSDLLGPNGGPQEALRYEIIDEIARGGMGVVYKARDTVLSRIVAYKILSEALKNNEQAVEYFVREARAAAKLNHSNIVTVYDAGSQSGEYYMAMEYIEGKTLKDLVTRQGPFPEKLVRYLLMHSCRGLYYAHVQGIVHRDIKSGNMMLTSADRQLKIMDFGLAKVLSGARAGNEHTRAVGTPFYMSPEQILGSEVDARSDIYSLGVTFFELATGTVPFFKGDVTYHHVHTRPPSPRSLNPAISADLERLILTAMEKRPEDRFASCDEILTELKRA